MKNKLFKTIILLTVLAYFLTGCSKKATGVKDNGKEGKRLSIVTTIFPQYDFVKQIVKDKADVTMLLKPGAESHSFEPTPQDIKKAEASDLVIYVGGENDVWIDGILKTLTTKPETMKLIDLVHTVDEEIVEGMEHEHEHEHGDKDHDKDHDDHDKDHDGKKGEEHHHEHEEHEVDEHVWTSPVNAIKIVEKITKKLTEKDPANKEFFENNAKEYIAKLKDLDNQFKDVVKNGKRDVILFADRFPFRYFADEYKLDYYAAFSGCSTETEASAATVAFLIDKVKEEKIPVVFTIELSNGKIANSVVDATGAKKLEFNSVHNVTAEQLKAGVSYYDLMLKNVEALKEALK